MPRKIPRWGPLLALALAFVVLATDAVAQTQPQPSTGGAATIYNSVFGRCIACDPLGTVIQAGLHMAEKVWAIFSTPFQYGVAVGLVFFLIGTGLRITNKSTREKARGDLLLTAARAGIVVAFFAPTVVSSQMVYRWVQDLLFIPTVELGLNTAAWIIEEAPPAAITTASRDYCRATIPSALAPDHGYLIGTTKCVIYTMQEATSWVVAVAAVQLKTMSWPPGVANLTALYLLFIGTGSLMKVPLMILQSILGFLAFIVALPVALVLWVFPSTQSAMRYYTAGLAEHGAYMVGLGIIAAIIPPLAQAAVIMADVRDERLLSGLPFLGMGQATTIEQVIWYIEYGVFSLEPWDMAFFVFVFFLKATETVMKVPENFGRRISGIITHGAGGGQ